MTHDEAQAACNVWNQAHSTLPVGVVFRDGFWGGKRGTVVSAAEVYNDEARVAFFTEDHASSNLPGVGGRYYCLLSDIQRLVDAVNVWNERYRGATVPATARALVGSERYAGLAIGTAFRVRDGAAIAFVMTEGPQTGKTFSVALEDVEALT